MITKSWLYILVGIIVLLVSSSAFLFWQLQNTNRTLEKTKSSFEEKIVELEQQIQNERASTSEALSIKVATINELASQLDLTKEELDDMEGDYKREKRKNDEFEEEYREVINTVKDLDKLSKTDKELLQKYSKIYFLNEHYIPESLKEVADKWKYSEDKNLELHSRVIPFFNDMLEDALEDGVELWVVSAYRSFGEQAQLKGRYVQTYGSGANTFSADQGYSEHQLGTTVDFTTRGLNGGLEGFGNTPAYEWLIKNAHKYGFVLSYPEDNSFYIYEPWHWRFVGEDLAKDLAKADAHFYDWEQRKIDEYLLNIFD